jgi:hypothetical protein
MLRTTIVAGGLLLAAGSGSASSPPAPHGTNFFSICRLSHFAPDDPIVRPGLPGASHPHEFFGNTSTNARSSLASLLAHGTTCTRRADTAAYWVPALYGNGHLVKPLQATIYYRIRSVDRVHPFPPGLKIVAGNAGATAPQSTGIVFWNCVYPTGPFKPSASIPECSRRRERMVRRPSAGYLRLNVNLPRLLGRQAPGQPEPPEPHGVQQRPALSAFAPGQGAEPAADRRLSNPRRRRPCPRLRRARLRPRRLLQRVAAGRADAPDRGVRRRE